MSEIKPKDIYRGRRPLRKLITSLFVAITLLITGAVVAFYALESYVVYEKGGAKLRLPILSGAAPEEEAEIETVVPGEIELDIIYVSPDTSGLEAVAGAGLEELKAVFVPAGSVNPEGINGFKRRLEDLGANAMILEMRPESGRLPYLSSVPAAYSYGTSGAEDLAETIASLRAGGIYLMAQISCCVDELMATRNTSIALKNADGSTYKESGRYWLDPYNSAVRGYAEDLARELALLGFDEILLTNLAHPAGGDVVYSQAITGERDNIACISSFAIHFIQSARDMPISDPLSDTEEGNEAAIKTQNASDSTAEPEASEALFPETEARSLRVSVMLEAGILRAKSEDEQSGQSAGMFFKIFDRVFIQSSAPELESDRGCAQELLPSGTINTRFVPVLSSAPDNGSWAVK